MSHRSLRMISCGGDSTLAEWDTETVSQERLQEIELEYNRLVHGKGMTPADITDKKDELRPGGAFDPNADTLLIPRMMGGSE